MDNDKLYTELVLQIRQGNEDAQERLAACVRGPLQAYVYRITMCDDLTQDIVQESMLEMLKILGKLNDADRFWPWLYKIALNKIRNHYRIQQRHDKAIRSKAEIQKSFGKKRQGLDYLITEEFKQIVKTTMNKLKPQHRAVLSMRCYDNMSYAQIADILDSTELNTRLTFFRAKKQLHKYLSKQGFGKGALLAALVMFGKMTAPGKAAAAGISVSTSTIEVGALAVTIGVLTTKTAIVTMTAASVITVGTVITTTQSGPPVDPYAAGNAAIKQSTPVKINKDIKFLENWYFFPDGAGGPVMTRLISKDEEGQSCCQWLQNDAGNYYYDTHKGTVHLTNHRSYNKNLSVRRLPTDTPELSAFLNQVEGSSIDMEHYTVQARNLLIITTGNQTNNRISRWARNYDVLQEEHFQYHWPASAGKVDDRDAMHVQGYGYYTIDGQIRGEKVEGTGFLPFYHDISTIRPAWIMIKAGDKQLFDNLGTATISNTSGTVNAAYPGGTFIEGLSRPWMGLHTIDTIRRDAARHKIWFETKAIGQQKVEIILRYDKTRLIYTVDLHRDLIDSIVLEDNQTEEQIGQLTFEYSQDTESSRSGFNLPRISKPSRIETPLDTLWMIWLSEEADL